MEGPSSGVLVFQPPSDIPPDKLQMLTDLFALADGDVIHTVTMGLHISNPTYASPTLHTAPLPQIPFILTTRRGDNPGTSVPDKRAHAAK